LHALALQSTLGSRSTIGKRKTMMSAPTGPAGTPSPSDAQQPSTGRVSNAGRPRVLVFGHSHAWCLQAALQKGVFDPTASHHEFAFVLLGSTTLPGGLTLRDATDRERLNPILEQLLSQHASVDAAPGVTFLSAYGGNHHNSLGLLRNRKAFDFVYPERPELPVTEDRPFLPYAAVRAIFAGEAETLRRCLVLLRQYPGVGRVAHLEGPPPIPSEDHIRRSLSETSKQPEASFDVSPATLRLKLWLCQRDVTRAACEAAGAIYLQRPDVAVDADGYLRKTYWRDSVHGNPAYGALVLSHVDQTLRNIDTEP
jgi:hypothetical protein